MNRERAPSGPVKVVVTNRPHSRRHNGIPKLRSHKQWRSSLSASLLLASVSSLTFCLAFVLSFCLSFAFDHPFPVALALSTLVWAVGRDVTKFLALETSYF